MDNKGQTTVFFTLMLSVLLIFTLTALEVLRIHMGKVKMMAAVHSMRSSIMADYHAELFERYHLLYIDPTYESGSDAVMEEKVRNYLEASLNDENGIYQFSIEDIAVLPDEGIMDHNMESVKEQMEAYEKEAGILEKLTTLLSMTENAEKNVESAKKETEVNGVELNLPESGEEQEERESVKEVEDPRDKLTDYMKLGILEYIAPGNNFSKEQHMTGGEESSFDEEKEENKDYSFQNIEFLKGCIKGTSAKVSKIGLKKRVVFVDYVATHFSSATNEIEDSVLQCEIEYILMGKNSDYDNTQAVVTELMWMRMPLNYAYLLTDDEKKKEALALAGAICVATQTEALIEVVKYLLLGCWACGETLQELQMLLNGEEIAYIKTRENWMTDLKTLAIAGETPKIVNGMHYGDYLMILLATRSGKKQEDCYRRMLNVMELNLSQEDPDFSIGRLVESLTIQGRIKMNALFTKAPEKEAYTYDYEEKCSFKETQ